VAQGVGIRGDLSLEEKSCLVGGMTFAGAAIDGGLLMDGAEIRNSHDVALDLTHARIGSKISAKGTKVQGTVDVNGAEVAGPLDLEGAVLTTPDFRSLLSAQWCTAMFDCLTRRSEAHTRESFQAKAAASACALLHHRLLADGVVCDLLD
jgi:hypothetical protein